MIDERIHAAVCDRPHKKVERIAIQRMSKRRELPCAHVAGQKKDALSSTPCHVKMLEAIENHDSLDSLARVFWKLGELTRHPSNLPNHPANYFLPLLLRSSLETPDAG